MSCTRLVPVPLPLLTDSPNADSARPASCAPAMLASGAPIEPRSALVAALLMAPTARPPSASIELFSTPVAAPVLAGRLLLHAHLMMTSAGCLKAWSVIAAPRSTGCSVISRSSWWRSSSVTCATIPPMLRGGRSLLPRKLTVPATMMPTPKSLTARRPAGSARRRRSCGRGRLLPSRQFLPGSCR